MRGETLRPNGTETWIAGLVGMKTERFRRVTLTARDLDSLTILNARYSSEGDGRLLRGFAVVEGGRACFGSQGEGGGVRGKRLGP